MKRHTYILILVALVLLGIGVYAGWYSFDRHTKIAQAEKCNDMLTNPLAPVMMTAPDGTLAPVYSVNVCLAVVVPPSLLDLLRGHIVFESVPERMKVNPYSFMDVLLGQYTFGPALTSGCDQSATTTDCSKIPPQSPPPESFVPAENQIVPVSTAEVPEGWYAHLSSGYDGSETILTKTPELPRTDPNNYAYGEHIAIVEREISLTPPDQYVERNVSVSGPTVQYATWGTLFGRKMLSIGFTDPNDGSRQQSIYLFGGGRFVLINLYPDKQENRAAFQQVVNYYAQSLPMISRNETLAACKTVNLPPGQEYDILGDPETGYVTVGYWLGTGPGMGGKETYAFFNYNDDLSQCNTAVARLLTTAKAAANKMTQ